MRQKKTKRPKQDIIIEVNTRKLTLFLLILAMLLLTVLGGARVVRDFMRVKHFEVKGISVYEHSDLINASGVKRGDLL